jgi:chromosome segregation ATPase
MGNTKRAPVGAVPVVPIVPVVSVVPVVPVVPSAPAVNGTTSLSDSLTMANNLKAAITLFASGSGLQILSQLTDLIPELNNDIQKKDGQIQGLSAQLVAEKETHSADQMKQLKVFSNMYDAWRDEKAILQSTAKAQKKYIEKKSKEVMALQTKLDDMKAAGNKIESMYKEKASILREKEARIEALEEHHKKAKADAQDLTDKLNQSRTRVTQQETILGDYKHKHDKLEEEYIATKKERDEVLSYAAPLNKVDLPML